MTLEAPISAGGGWLCPRGSPAPGRYSVEVSVIGQWGLTSETAWVQAARPVRWDSDSVRLPCALARERIQLCEVQCRHGPQEEAVPR